MRRLAWSLVALALAPGCGSSSSKANPDGGGFTPGMAITATADSWTWVPFDNAFCGNGTATGIGVNLSSTGSRVLIYLEGGGACWDQLTCDTLMSATNFHTGYGEANFVVESTSVAYLAEPNGFFDRTSAANPFKDYSYVYVPYCTGDIFAGNNVTTIGASQASFVGYANMTAFLERIVPTFPSADRVILSGSSAGGFGALYNWYQTQNAFGKIRVDLLDDSGTFMPPDPGNGAHTTQSAAWNLPSTAPPCAACETDPSQYYGYYAKLYPDHKGALLSYAEDTVLPEFFGITTSQFTTGLDADIRSEFMPHKNLQVFVDGGAGHVLFFTPTLTQGTTSVQTFVTQMVTDDAAWASVTP